MRLLQLDLLRYGVFTGKTLAFRPGARVHVVHGGNEAGKSTALAALGDLLYGFPKSTDYDFVHEMKTLRLGAEVEARDGRRLTFQRTKGNKNTVRGADDMPLPDDSLAPFLGGVGRDLFEQAFGLSTRALRAGAEALLNHDGELGAALLGAASGVGDLQNLRDRLEEEADAIVGKRKAADRPFWQALSLYETASRAIRDNQLTAPQWKELNTGIARISDQIATSRKRLHEIAIRKSRIARLRHVAPIIARIGERLGAIDALGALPAARIGFGQELGKALATRVNAVEAQERADAVLTRLRGDLQALSLDNALIAADTDITALAHDVGADTEARNSFGRAEDACARSSRKLRDLAALLGLDDPDALQDHRPSAAALARVKSLADEGRRLESRLQAARNALSEEDANLEDLERRRAASPPLIDPAPLRDDMGVFEADLADIEDLGNLRIEIAEETRQLNEAARQLTPPCNLELLAAAPRPSEETVARFKADFDKLHRELEKAEAAHQEAQADVETLTRDVDRLKVDGEVATPEALDEARKAREQALNALRLSIESETAVTVAEQAVRVIALEIAIIRTDRLADVAILDAGRIREFGLKSHSLRIAEEKARSASDRIESTSTTLSTLDDIWTDAWGDLALAPLPPAEMASWLSRVENLLARRDPLERKRERLRQLEESARDLKRTLSSFAAKLDLKGLEGFEAPALAARIKARIGDIERNWQGASDLASRLAESRERADKAQRSVVRLEAEMDDWLPLLSDVLPSIALPRGAALDEVEAALGIWDQVPQALEAHAETLRTRERLEATMLNFAERTQRIVGQLAPDLAGRDPGSAVRALNARLIETREAKARHVDATQRLIEAESAEQQAFVALADADAAVRDLRELAGIDPDIDLVDLSSRFEARDRLIDLLKSDRDLLARQSEGETEDELRLSLAAFDPDAAHAELEDLDRERDRTETEEKTLHTERDRLQRRREELEQGNNAELALQRRTGAEADLIVQSREWVVLKLAAALVSRATAQHRASHHVPLMERAGALFSQLTGGSFSGLGPDEDEDGRVLLVGLRPNGDKVGIGRIHEAASRKASDLPERSRLSEGTLDQLYLAMRLAHLEDYARSAEPAPFIGDDLFMTFDDDRTALGLKALADLSGSIQPIVFTHHSRVAEIAADTLGNDADIIRL